MRRIFISALCVLAASPLLAGLNQWTGSAPEGASISRFVTDPTNPAVVYAASYGGGVFKSDDASDSWRPVNAGLSDHMVYALAAQPNAWSTLYAATGGGRLFKTVDGGEQWVMLSDALPSTPYEIAFGLAPGTLYVGTSKGLYRTTDDGATWQRIDPLRDSTTNPGSVRALAADARGNLYLSVDILYRSSDGGDSWVAVVGFPGVSHLAFDRPTSSLFLSQGKTVYRLRDGGQTIETLPSITADAYVSSLFGEGTGRDAVYATAGGSIFQYLEDDKTWRAMGIYSPGWVNAGARGNVFPARLYAGTSKGVFTNEEATNTWPMKSRGINAAPVSDIAAASSQHALMYAATAGGIYRIDDEASWTQINPDLTDATSVAIDEHAPNTVYASNSSRVEKSTDDGTTWKKLQTPGAFKVAVSPSDSATLYASLTNGLAKSSDGGESWRGIGSGLSAFYYYGYYYGYSTTAIAVDPTRSATVFVAEGDGLYKTTDAGAHWAAIGGAERKNALAIAIDPVRPDTVYAATSTGLAKSLDGGITFTTIGFADGGVSTIAIDPTVTYVVYAGTRAGIVYRTPDGGATWERVGESLFSVPINRLLIDSSGKHLKAATSGGVFHYDIE